MLRFHHVVLSTLSLAISAAMGSQAMGQIVPRVIDFDMAFDDQGPTPPVPNDLDGLSAFAEGWGPIGAPVMHSHGEALQAQMADIDGDGFPDLVLGGIGRGADVGEAPSAFVRVHFYEWTAHGKWAVRESEDIPDAWASSCYDLSVGDVDLDGFVDLAIGRRTSTPKCAGTPPTNELSEQTWDSVLFNADGIGEQGTHFEDVRFLAPSGALRPSPSCDTTQPNDLVDPTDGSEPNGYRQTFAMDLHDFDNDGDLDAITAGKYGVAYSEYTGSRTFADAVRFDDGDPDQGPSILSAIYREFDIGDVDGDNLPDLVVPRRQLETGFTTAEPNIRTYINQLDDATTPEFAPQPDMIPFVAPKEISFEIVGANCNTSYSDTFGIEFSTFEVALGDLDGDGAPDLIVSSVGGANAAYLNDGQGVFGAWDGGSPPVFTKASDGGVAYEFPAVTPDWVGSSANLEAFVFVEPSVWTNLPSPPAPPQVDPSLCTYEFTVPGHVINHTAGVIVHDRDSDGVVDEVVFSNRSDWEYTFSVGLAQLISKFDGLEDGAQPEPPNEVEYAAGWGLLTLQEQMAILTPPDFDVFDHVFFNATSQEKTVIFEDFVELVGEDNDGTAYSELVQWNMVSPLVDGVPLTELDSAPDWIEGNFRNLEQGATGPGGVVSEAYPNYVIWGQPARLINFDYIDGFDPVGTSEVELTIALDLLEGHTTEFIPETEVLNWMLLTSTEQYPDSTSVSCSGLPSSPTCWDDVLAALPSGDESVLRAELARMLGFDSLSEAVHADIRSVSGVVERVVDPTIHAAHHIEITASIPEAALAAHLLPSMQFFGVVVLSSGPVSGPSIHWVSNPIRIPLELN